MTVCSLEGRECLLNVVFESFNVLSFLFQLAHEAFKKAQSLDPNYVSCWIGQVCRT